MCVCVCVCVFASKHVYTHIWGDSRSSILFGLML